MTTVSYKTHIFNWLSVHIRLPHQSNMKSVPCTGYTAAYPKIKYYHRQKSNQLFSCLSLFDKSKKKNLHKKNSSIKGCASFARYDKYKEGDIEDDC